MCSAQLLFEYMMSELGWKFSVTFKIPACAQHPKCLLFPTVSLLQDFLSHPGVLCGNSTTKYKIPGNFNNLQCRAMAITEDVFYIKKVSPYFLHN